MEMPLPSPGKKVQMPWRFTNKATVRKVKELFLHCHTSVRFRLPPNNMKDLQTVGSQRFQLSLGMVLQNKRNNKKNRLTFSQILSAAKFNILPSLITISKKSIQYKSHVSVTN